VTTKRPAMASIVMLILVAYLGVASPDPATPADVNPFDTSLIPATLIKGADLVVREEVQVFEIESIRAATRRVRVVTTVMNARGRDAGVMVLPYDGFQKVRYLTGKLLNDRGKEVRHLAGSDIQDYSAIQGFSLYEDGRVKYAELSHDKYPYTVIYEYEIVYKGILGWPSWWPQNEKGPVQKSRFEIRAPSDMPVRHHMIGLSVLPKVTEEGGRRIYRWSLSNQPKLEIEPLGPSYREQAPHLLTGPVQFEIAGKPGDMTSWNSFGAWFHDLWDGRADLSEPDAARVRDLCAGAGTDIEKVRRLYEYLQSKTRYVSVQLGIGGWQPFDASYVSQQGYGDCKALTNYMLGMLDVAGIKSWPAFVMAGRHEPDLVESFPSNQFNHVILLVPTQEDTIWLECTSQDQLFGELGAFTEDRNTLVATSSGGFLVRTPVTSAGQNRLIRKAQVTLNPAGRATADITTRYTGNQQGDVRSSLSEATPRERDEWLHREIDIASFTVQSADFSDLDVNDGDLTLKASIEVPALGTTTGPRLFVRPNLANRWALRLPKAPGRNHPLCFPFAWVDADTISYRLPRAYTVESAPPDVTIETPFARYESSLVDRGSFVVYHRRLEIKQKSIETSDYEEFRRFLDEVVRADQLQMVLIRKT